MNASRPFRRSPTSALIHFGPIWDVGVNLYAALTTTRTLHLLIQCYSWITPDILMTICIQAVFNSLDPAHRKKSSWNVDGLTKGLLIIQRNKALLYFTHNLERPFFSDLGSSPNWLVEINSTDNVTQDSSESKDREIKLKWIEAISIWNIN